MLPPFIIEQIRKREQEEAARHNQEQPRLELPIPPQRSPSDRPEKPKTPEEERGVVILDLL
ncbi:MAG TPA: hypothetical protein VF407_16035 [Polyangiaceae bacterium]